MIDIEGLEITYDGADAPALLVPTLHVEEGELVLVAGPTGCGKSTLLSALNGLVPHFTGGTMRGRVVVAGRDTATHRPRDLADVVGVVRQNPSASFVTDTVEDEIAYGMEVLGVAPGVMRRRVEEILDVLGLADVRDRHLHELSGGQQQRVAIAAVLAAGPDVLVLDEPTSALDPVAAEDVLASLTRLVHDMALTVVLAEHRLERVVHHVDSVVLLDQGRATPALVPAEAMATSSVFPPIVGLGRLLRWSPLPLSVRSARRRATSLRAELPVPPAPTHPPPGDHLPGRSETADAAGVRARGLHVRRGGVPVLTGVDLAAADGGISVLMGRNGSGKSTLLWALAGRLQAHRGEIRISGPGMRPVDPRRLSPRERLTRVGLVPQDPMALLYGESVAEECRQADIDMRVEPGTTAGLFARITGDVDPGRHPRDLSEGQRLGLALAVILAAGSRLLLLDEPTRGLDYPAKARLVSILAKLSAEGHTILVATHDVELAAEIADRVLLMADGVIVADDDRRVLAESTAYAPQVSRILHPLPFLTVGSVAQSLQERVS